MSRFDFGGSERAVRKLPSGRHGFVVSLALIAAAGSAAAGDVDDLLRRGATARGRWEWDKAEAAFREAVVAADRGSGKLERARGRHALASLLHDRANYGDAVKVYREELAILAEAQGEQSLPYISCLNNVGQALSDWGHYKSARKELERSVDLVRALKPGALAAEAECLNALALLCRREGKYDEAVRHYSDALALIGKLPAFDAAFLAAVTLNLGVVLTEQGELEKAENCLRGCSLILEKFRQTGSVQHAACLHATARLRLRQKDVPGGRTAAEQAVEVCRTALGDKHPRTATSLDVLAEVRLAEGKPADAARLIERVLFIREATFGPKSVPVAEASARAARAARALDKPKEALAALARSHEILLATFGKQVPAHLGCVVTDYAELPLAEGRVEEARRVAETLPPKWGATRGEGCRRLTTRVHPPWTDSQGAP